MNEKSKKIFTGKVFFIFILVAFLAVILSTINTISSYATYTNNSFTLVDQRNGRGIVVNDTRFNVLQVSDERVYEYYRNGTYTGSSFSYVNECDGGSYVGNKLASTQSKFFVVCQDFFNFMNDRVYEYYRNGTYTGDFFSTDQSLIQGIYTNGTYIWTLGSIGGSGIQYVIERYMNGTKTGFNFSLEVLETDQGSSLSGLYFDGEFFWITQYSPTDSIYKFTDKGVYTNSKFNTNDEQAEGLTGNTTHLWFITGNQKQFVDEYKIDNTFPIVSFTNGTEINNSNFSRDWIFTNVTIEEDNFKRVNFSLYYSNKTLVNSTTFEDSTREINWTNLDEGLYYYNVTATDLGENTNSTETRVIRLDNTGPSISIIDPKNQNYNNNDSIPLNFSSTDSLTNTESCWYKVVNSSDSLIIDNTTLINCENTTFGLPGGDVVYTLTLYSNDSLGNENLLTRDFGIQTVAPSIVLDYPDDETYFDFINNINFNFTATTSGTLDTCQLYSNFTGTWEINETFSSVTSGVQVNTQKNLSDNEYLWNVECNDTLGNKAFALTNKTFVIDTITPEISINSFDTTAGSQTFNFNSTIVDTNIGTCKYSIYNSTGGIDGTNENVSYTCNSNPNSATATAYGNFTLRAYTEDLAGNEEFDEENFTLSASEGGTTIIRGGSSGGSQVSPATNWSIQVAPGVSKYEKELPLGTSVTLRIEFENLGESARTITLTCEDVFNDVCQYVTFEEETFELPLIKDTKRYVFFTITIPETAERDDYLFNVVATDEVGGRRSISVDLGVSTAGFFLDTFSKLGLNTPGGFPYFVIFLASLILSAIILSRILKEQKFKLKQLLVFLVSLGIGLVTIYLIPFNF